jgi:ABC-type transport system involved in cytochrome c biogenesis permease subunit
MQSPSVPPSHGCHSEGRAKRGTRNLLFHPRRRKYDMKKAFPILTVLTAFFLGYALYLALYVAPTEQTMGDVQRIFYIHVPSAWTAFLLFFINFVASIQFLVHAKPAGRRTVLWITLAIGVIGAIVPFFFQPQLHQLGMEPGSLLTTALAIPLFFWLVGKYFSGPASSGQNLDALAVTCAEVGVVFCTIVLITGPLWARPVWGIWWAAGDVRLTSTLVLWLISVSYLVLRRFSNSAQTQTLAAALAVFGALDVPLVYFSIWFFRTQHPQPVIGGGGSIDPRMLHVLLISWLAFLCLAFLLCWTRYRMEQLTREVEEAEAMESLEAVS